MSSTTTTPPWTDAQKNLAAVLGSILINLSVLYVIGYLLILEATMQPKPKEAEVNEVVVSLDELLPEFIQPEEDPTKSKSKSYIETYQNQESETAPENAIFESDRNTIAATEMAPTEPGELPTPTQDGDDLPVIEMQDHNYVDGPDGEISSSAASMAGAPASAQTPQLPSPDTTPQPETVADVPPAEPAETETENPDPEAEESQENPAEGTMAEGAPTELEEDEAGGAPDPIEMAKVDMPKREDYFSDNLEVVDEKMVEETDTEEAMPEKNPEELKERLRPFASSPESKANPTMVPTPFMKPKDAAVPLPEGSMPSAPTNGQADEAAFSPERHKNKMSGSLSNIGRNPAVDAEQTPMGQYKKLVSRAIERRWHILKDQYATFISFGSLKISFEVDRRGDVSNLRLLHDDANHTVTTFSQQAILTADIPPMPQEIIDLLGEQKLEVTYDIIIY